MDSDVLIVGGGVAGLSLAAALSGHRRVTVLEAEDAIGHHSSGRSATFSHFGIGNEIVRGLTAASRAFFQKPPAGFSEVPVARTATALFVATEKMLPTLDTLEQVMRPHAPGIRPVGEAEMRVLFPPLRTGRGAVTAGLVDADGLRLDADSLLQGYARAIRSSGGKVLTGQRVAAVDAEGGGWTLVTESGARHSATILVNAAGAWADGFAHMAGVAPLGLRPLRRTIIIVDPPEGADVAAWPFVKTVVDDFYILPEGGRLAASPVDEVPDDPCDAQPEDYDIALAAWKVEEYTTLSVPRVQHRWAGLRTFTSDRTPVAGFDPIVPGFFWLAGQGGFGLQTAPAIAEAAASLLLSTAWPEQLAALGISPHVLGPERLIHG